MPVPAQRPASAADEREPVVSATSARQDRSATAGVVRATSRRKADPNQAPRVTAHEARLDRVVPLGEAWCPRHYRREKGRGPRGNSPAEQAPVSIGSMKRFRAIDDCLT